MCYMCGGARGGKHHQVCVGLDIQRMSEQRVLYAHMHTTPARDCLFVCIKCRSAEGEKSRTNNRVYIQCAYNTYKRKGFVG